MDQTPIPFTFQARITVNAPGSHTVHIRKSTAGDTKPSTYVVTVTASGKLLKPLIVFSQG